MDLKQADKHFGRLRKLLDYQKYMTPTNYSEENSKFLTAYHNQTIYDPQYTYKRFNEPEGRAEALALYSEFKNAESGVNAVLSNALKELVSEFDMYSAIGDDEAFTDIGISLFGKPDPKYYDEALKMLHSTDPEIGSSLNRYSAEQLKEVFTARLAAYSLNWDIIILNSMAARVSVEPDQKSIYISAKAGFTKNDIMRLCYHEIDTHVLRAENGERSGFHVLSSGTSGALVYEEGLASYNEWKHGVRDEFTVSLYAARFLSCINISMSFYDMFDFLIKRGCSENVAMYVVPRIKRGISDTSKPGGFIKDYVYFQGFYEIKDFIAAHPNEYEKLYFGSVSLTDLNLLKTEIDHALSDNKIILPLRE